MGTIKNDNKLIITGRGTTALWAILKALNSQYKGVLIPVNICELVVPAIYSANMTPVYYDVHPVQGNADLNNIKKAYTKETSVLLLVHNFGSTVDLGKIIPWAKKTELFTIEDVCNSHGATFKSMPVGLFGNSSIYSFGCSKILEVGVGGGLRVRDSKIREKVLSFLSDLPTYNNKLKIIEKKIQTDIRLLRSRQGRPVSKSYKRLYSDYINYLLYDVNKETKTKIISKLNELPKILSDRNSKSELYRAYLSSPKITHRDKKDGDVCWRYTFLVPPQKRDIIVKELRKENIHVSTWFPPIHVLFDPKASYKDFPNAYYFSKRVINLWVDRKTGLNEIKKTAGLIDAILR